MRCIRQLAVQFYDQCTSPPASWSLRKSSYDAASMGVGFLCWMAIVVARRHSYIVEGQRGPMACILVMLVLSLTCFAIKSRKVMKLAPGQLVETLVLLISWVLSTAAKLECVQRAATEDRVRALATFVALARFAPLAFHWRLGPSLIYAIVGGLTDVALRSISQSLHGDSESLPTLIGTCLVITSLYIPFSAHTRNQFQTEQAFERLLTIQNDAVISVDTKGVICSDTGFDGLMGKNGLTGHTLASCLCDEEAERLDTAFASCKDSWAPVSLPTSLSVDGEVVKADFSIVLQQASPATFLVGIRCLNERLPKIGESIILETNGEVRAKMEDESSLASLTTDQLMSSGLNEDIVQLGMREHWLISESHLRWDSSKLLGKGGYGEVSTATFHGAEVAVKTSLEDLANIQSTETLAIKELRMLRYMRHPKIVSFLGACLNSPYSKVQLVFELVDGGITCTDLVCNPAYDPFSKNAVEQSYMCTALRDVCSALCYMHAIGCVHRDVKPDNILIELMAISRLRAKLSDFGLSHHVGKKKRAGTLRWMAPEAFRSSDTLGTPADVFSFGRLIYYLTTGEKPLSNLTDSELKEASSSSACPILDWPAGMAIPEIVALAQRCMTMEPLDRPFITDVLSSVSAWQASVEKEIEQDTTVDHSIELSRVIEATLQHESSTRASHAIPQNHTLAL